jgi:biopolymer transport protein ExbD
MEFSRSSRKLRAISMVSLIDIVFVIILFFLVAGHLEKYTVIEVDLPRADSGQHLDEGPIVVLLGKYGDVVINDVRFEGVAVADHLRQEFINNPERIVTIKADARLEANALVDFLENIRGAGGKNLSIVTDSGVPTVAP